MRALLFAVLLYPSAAFAVGKFLSLGFAGGGTDLASRTGYAGHDLNAGSGWYFSGGILLPVSDTVPHAFEAQLGIGYFFTDSGKDDNIVSFSRVPLEAIYYYRNTENRFRFGWGAIYHFENRIRGKGVHSAAGADVDPALGWTLSAQKFLRPQSEQAAVVFGVRYNSIRYKSPRFSSPADGSAFLFTVEGQWF